MNQVPMEVLRAESNSLAATRALAAALAEVLRPGDAICLEGDLGAGKTAFVAGLVAALGSDAEVTSPTFTLENRYRVEGRDFDLFLHCDLYRPGEDARRDLLPSMLEARDEGAVLAVEWAAPVEEFLRPLLRLKIEVVDERQRRFGLEPVPAGWPAFADLAREWEKIRGGSA